jgi:hypothetical protein
LEGRRIEMKKIVMEKDQDVVSIDEIDNSSIVGTAGFNGKGFVALVFLWGEGNKRNKRYAEILFCRGHSSPNIVAHPKKQKKSVRGAAKHAIKKGKEVYLFDSKRELFEWGLEGLED